MNQTKPRLFAFVSLLFTLAPASLVYAIPPIQHWVADSGARVYYVHAPEIPIIDVRVVFAAGSARDNGQFGLANLTSALLNDGAAELDADAFSEGMAATGASLDTGSRRDMAWVSLRTLAEGKYSTPALALMADVLSQPRFDADAFTRRQAQAIIGLTQVEQSPSAQASRAFYQSIYGTHPYASPVSGVKETVTALQRSDAKTFHDTYYVATNAVIGIVGALTKNEAEQLVNKITADMKLGTAAPSLPAVNPKIEGGQIHIEFPSMQTHVRVGQPGMKRGDVDYFPLLVGNHALGGNSLVSILFQEVRDKRGLSYSVYSHFTPMAELGPFIAGLQTDRSQQTEALDVLRQTIADFIEKGPPEDALESAKLNLVGGFPLRIDSNSKIVEYITMIGFYDLPLDYLEQFPKRVEQVTAADVKDAFSRRLDPKQMITITVGQAAE